MTSTAVTTEDPGADLAAAAVAAMTSTGAVRAAADAVELQAVATLAHVRRSQAVARARACAREADVARGLVPGTTPPARVDVDRLDRLTSQEVSVALTVSPVVARERLELARELVERRPVTFEALRHGQVDLVRARRICDAVRALPLLIPDGSAEAHGDDASQAHRPDAADPGRGVLAAAVEAEVLLPGSVPMLADLRPARSAGELTPAQLTARLARLVMRADPRGATDRTSVADTRRGCSLRALPDGMALLSVTGRAELLGAAFARLDSTAQQLLAADARTVGRHPRLEPGAGAGRDAARTLDQTRVDVFLATLLGDSDDLARAHNVHVELALLVPVGTIMAGGDEPGDLDGHGPVPAPLARALAADARWRRWSTDPITGHVTSTGSPCGDGGSGGDLEARRRRTYRPSAEIADLVRARDRTCRFPTCRRRAQACDLDHVTPFPHGPTCHTNIATECRLHHICKHQGGFGLSISPDGITTWTTPTGQRLVTHPPSWGRPPPRARIDPAPEPEPDPYLEPVDPPPF